MATIVTRTGKGSALTFAEGDANFTNLNNAKLEDITNESISDLSDVNITGGVAGGTVSDVDDVRNPNVITLDGGDPILVFNMRIRFTGTDVTAAGLVENQDYYIAADIGNDQFEIANSLNGAPISLTDPGAITDFNWTAPDINSAGISNGQTLIWDTANNRFNAGNISVTSLTQNLDANSFKIQDVQLEDYKETVFNIGTQSGTLNLDVQNGNVQTVNLNGNITINGFTNAEAGQSMTVIIKQDGTGNRTLSSSMFFAGGEKTLTTTGNSTDILSIFYDGTDYWASLSTDFK
jgi:hypothetical protein